MIGGVQHNKGLFILKILDLANLCESPTSLKVVRAGFTGSYRLYEGNKFVYLAKRGSDGINSSLTA